MKILFYPDETLRKKSEKVSDFGDGLQQTAKQMLETMYAANGLGLAAPQVGLLLRLAVLNCVGTPEGELVLVNPEIVERQDKVVGEEGCLSFPGIFLKVRRAARIKVRYQDLCGEQKTLEADGLLSRAIQQEIDHMDGVLLVDKMTPVQRLANRRSLKMLERRHAGTDDTVLG